MNKALLISIIVIGTIAVLALAAFLVFFFIHRSYFNKLKKHIKNYDEIRAKLHNVNFYRLDVLAQNKMLNQQKFTQLKNNWDTLNENCHTIYVDLKVLDDEIRKMNFKEAKRISYRIASDIEKTQDDASIFLEEFNKSTQYSDGIEDSLQIAIDLFNDIKEFYYANVIHNQNFNAINELIARIQEIIDKNAEFATSYDFDAIVRIFIDLHSKIKILWKSINAVLKLQLVDVYLLTAKDNNNKLLIKSNIKLVYKDNEYISKANNLFEKHYEEFKKAYLGFDIVNAFKFASIAADDMAKISKFCYVNSSSLELINESIGVINEQTDSVIKNKDKILQSINSLAFYFAKDQKTLSYFNQIDSDVKLIEELYTKANNVSSLSVDDKLEALKQLQAISLSIAKCKENIGDSVSHINYTLSHIITLLTRLNELYTYYIQMLPTIKVLGNDNPVRSEFIALINNNILIIQACVREIITSDNPDFKEISSKINSMVEETQHVKEKINSTIILKSYANKLMFYANRYKKEATISLFDKAEEEYRSKKYSQCIDTLLLICKKFK